MSLQTASLLACIGTLLLSVLEAFGFVRDVSALASGVLPLLTVLSSAIHLFAYAMLTVFFYTCHCRQS